MEQLYLRKESGVQQRGSGPTLLQGSAVQGADEPIRKQIAAKQRCRLSRDFDGSREAA